MSDLRFVSRRSFVSAAAVSLAAPLAAQPQPPAEEGRWAFVPTPDRFRSDALLDLRYLNEKTAGETGFVRVAADGGFLRGDGSPLRFWAANTDVARESHWRARPLGPRTPPDLGRHARFLAKRGVNLVRLHAHLNPPVKTHPEIAMTAIDTEERDWIWRTVAAMKNEGIYCVISPYWANTMRFSAAWDMPGGADLDAHSLLFFDARLQGAYRAWLKALLAEDNPHTGMPLARDPAVAVIQLQNEDSLLFWSVAKLAGPQRQDLARKYATWASRKYGSVEAALTAWDGQTVKGDDPPNGILEFHHIYEMTQPRKGGFKRRLDDQLQFWAETMYHFNADTAMYLRQELGCRQLINAGNWKTADTRLEDAERWSYTANDVIAVNRYLSGVHKGKNSGWAIGNGDEFTSPSVLLDPLAFPLNLKQVRGYPFMVTESSWVMPNAYSTEGPFLVAAYQSLTGVGAYCWFATGDDEWTAPQSANGFMPSQQKWMFGNPDMLGTFPAAALMYRKGYVKRGEPVVIEERSLADLWQRRTPVITESPSFDPNRDAGDIAPESSVKTGVNPLAFLAGPVLTVYGGDPKASRVADLKTLIADGGRQVTSNTGEIVLHSGKGYCTVDTPKAQGVAAFFRNRQEFRLSTVEIRCANAYGTVLVVAMDDRPIAQSRKLLVQVGTESRPTGWRERSKQIELSGGKTVAGNEVVDFGRAPWQVVRPLVTVGIANSLLGTGTVLDMNGEARGSLRVEKTAKGVRFDFPGDALYVVLS